MVRFIPAGDGCGGAFELEPHRSLSTRGARLFYAGVAFPGLLIAGFFAVFGFWPVLPFTGLELGLLALVLAQNVREGRLRERIRIDERHVRIERGYGGVFATVGEFLRGWVRVILERPERFGRPARLWLGSHGRRVEIGAFLVEDERRRLAKELKDSIAQVVAGARDFRD